MVKIMENHTKMDDLGGKPTIFGGPPISHRKGKNQHHRLKQWPAGMGYVNHPGVYSSFFLPIANIMGLPINIFASSNVSRGLSPKQLKWIHIGRVSNRILIVFNAESISNGHIISSAFQRSQVSDAAYVT